VVGKPAARRAYYARWVEFGHRIGYRGSRLARQQPISEFKGRRRRLEILRRRRAIRTGGVRAHPFLYTFSRAELYQPYQKLWGRALHKAAQGAVEE
jgi:hypothetical protein